MVEGAGTLGRWMTHSQMTAFKDPKEAQRMVSFCYPTAHYKMSLLSIPTELG